MVLAPLAPTNANNMATKENVTRLAADDSLFVDATTGVTAGIDPAMKAKYDEKIDLVGEFKRGWLAGWLAWAQTEALVSPYVRCCTGLVRRAGRGCGNKLNALAFSVC